MADLVSFFSLSTLFLLLAGATNTNNGSLAMKAYWNEVFPGIPIPDVIRALLPSPTQTSGLVGRGYGNVDIVVKSSRSWIRLWSVLGDAHNDRSNNWSPNLAPLYFLRKDLLSGSKMNVTMMITPSANEASTVGGVSSEPTFLPRKQAHEIPFSTSNLTTILKMFSIEPHSHHASLTRQTLVDCKMPALKGELKYCATSLESMIDFVVAEFGTNEIHAAITSVVNREEEVKARIYRVGVGGGG
ncbi:BURP domain-containing protein 5-like [Nymphaea colorata]|nr:BURP domain-containing protein 5-like [Nymphaea colorata]